MPCGCFDSVQILNIVHSLTMYNVKYVLPKKQKSANAMVSVRGNLFLLFCVFTS